jgi:serine/threonine protein kinase
VGTHSDQFALAVTTYVLLTGRLPWRGTTAISILYSVVNREPLPLNDSTFPAVELVLRRGMTKKPQGRYPSVLAFWQELCRALTKERLLSDTAYPMTPIGRGKTRPFIPHAQTPVGTMPLSPAPLSVPLIAQPMEEEDTDLHHTFRVVEWKDHDAEPGAA